MKVGGLSPTDDAPTALDIVMVMVQSQEGGVEMILRV